MEQLEYSSMIPPKSYLIKRTNQLSTTTKEKPYLQPRNKTWCKHMMSTTTRKSFIRK